MGKLNLVELLKTAPNIKKKQIFIIKKISFKSGYIFV